MLIRDHWYVGCRSGQLTDASPEATQIGDLDLVLFRDLDGRPKALLDRCCHRGVKLSLGRMAGGNVSCGYHGWEFDGDGRLVRVPSLIEGEKMPSCSVPSFPVVERDFYVWVWVAGESEIPTYEPGLIGIGNRQWIQQTNIWDVNIMDAVENQLDVSHTAFSHPGIYPGHKTDDGVPPPLRQFAHECGLVDGGVEIHVPPRSGNDEVPRRWDQMRTWARFELPYRNYVYLVNEKTLAIYNWVPQANGSCRLEFMGAKIDESESISSAPMAVFMEQELKLLLQDRTLLESARPWIDKGRRDFEKSVPQDFPQLLARRLHRSAREGRTSTLQDSKMRIVEGRA